MWRQVATIPFVVEKTTASVSRSHARPVVSSAIAVPEIKDRFAAMVDRERDAELPSVSELILENFADRFEAWRYGAVHDASWLWCGISRAEYIADQARCNG